MSLIYSKIVKIEDLYDYAPLIQKGIMKMPNISKISKDLNKDRRTIAKALRGEVTKKTRKRNKYLDAFRNTIIELLTDKYREFDYLQHLYDYLKREHEIKCCYSTLKNYINNDEELKEYFKHKKVAKFTERFETEPGQQAQFDLKEKVPMININGKKTLIYVATLTMGFSRYNIRKIIPDTSYESVSTFLAQAFDELGGVPKELVIDNIKCLVDKPRSKGKDAIINSKFIEFAKDYDFEIKPCMPYRAQTKGKVETQHKIVEQLKNYNGTYNDFHDVSKILEIITKEDNDKVSQATNYPAVFLKKEDVENLKPLPNKKIREKYYLADNSVKVSTDSFVSYKSNKYSVPQEYIGKYLNRVIKNNNLYIYDSTKLVTIHQISSKKINKKEEHDLKYSRNSNITKKSEEKIMIIDEMRGVIFDNCK